MVRSDLLSSTAMKSVGIQHPTQAFTKEEEEEELYVNTDRLLFVCSGT